MGAKAGIGAGVAGGVLFLAAVGIAVWLLKRRTKRVEAAAASQQQQPPPPPQYPQSPHIQQMAGYPSEQGMPWMPPYPQTDQYYSSGYRGQDVSPGEHEERRLGSMMKDHYDHKTGQHLRVPSEGLRPLELEGEGPGTVHEIGEGDGGGVK